MKKDKKKFSIINIVIWAILGFLIGAGLTYATSSIKVIDLSLVTSSLTLAGAGVGLLAGFVVEVSKLMSGQSNGNEKTKIKNKDGDIKITAYKK